jgi:predicted negative regulator of RcsB-dependent stress response
MDWTTRALIAGAVLALLCWLAWRYVRSKPWQKPPGDDWGGEL